MLRTNYRYVTPLLCEKKIILCMYIFRLENTQELDFRPTIVDMKLNYIATQISMSVQVQDKRSLIIHSSIH